MRDKLFSNLEKILPLRSPSINTHTRSRAPPLIPVNSTDITLPVTEIGASLSLMTQCRKAYNSPWRISSTEFINPFFDVSEQPFDKEELLRIPDEVYLDNQPTNIMAFVDYIYEVLVSHPDTILVKDQNNSLFESPITDLIPFVNTITGKMSATLLLMEDLTELPLMVLLKMELVLEKILKQFKNKNRELAHNFLQCFNTTLEICAAKIHIYSESKIVDTLPLLSPALSLTYTHMITRMMRYPIKDPLKTFHLQFHHAIKHHYAPIALVGIFHCAETSVTTNYSREIIDLLVKYPSFVYKINTFKQLDMGYDNPLVVDINDENTVTDIALYIITKIYSRTAAFEKALTFLSNIFLRCFGLFYQRSKDYAKVAFPFFYLKKTPNYLENLVLGMKLVNSINIFHLLPEEKETMIFNANTKLLFTSSLLMHITVRFDDFDELQEFSREALSGDYAGYGPLTSCVVVGRSKLIDCYVNYLSLPVSPFTVTRIAFETAVRLGNIAALEALFGGIYTLEDAMKLITPQRFNLVAENPLNILLTSPYWTNNMRDNEFHHLSVLQFLLNYGADIFSPGFCAVEKSVEYNHLDAFTMLISYAASLVDKCELFLIFRIINMNRIKTYIQRFRQDGKTRETAEKFAEKLRIFDSLTKRCRFCGNPCSKRCSRCKVAFYCSNECHESDWVNHSKMCESYQHRLEQLTQNDF